MADKVNPMQIQKFLKGVEYPCTKEDLLTMAEEEGADDMVLETLRSLRRENFNNPNDVSEAIGEMDDESMMDDEDMGMDEDMDDDEMDEEEEEER